MSETLAEQILSAMPHIRCACGEQVSFRIVRDPSSQVWRFFAQHSDREIARELDEYTLYEAGCSRVSVIHNGVGILRKMAERLLEDCQHAAWHSNAPFAPVPTAKIEFRDGRTERMAIRPNNHAFNAEAYLPRLDPRMSPFSGVSANHAAEQFSLLGRAAHSVGLDLKRLAERGQTPPAPAAKPTKPATAPAPRSLLL